MGQPKSERDRMMDEAIDLIIRFQNDPDNPVSLGMIHAWRNRSADHEAVWQRVSMVHGASGRILDEKRRIERRESFDLTRRGFLLGGMAVLGAGAYAFGPELIVQARADHITASGEIRRIELPDHSIATLGPKSAIALDFQEGRREVNLLTGMSFFEVASVPGLPFIVASGDVSATTLGTSFDMSSNAGLLTVSVERGSVEVKAPALLPGMEGTLRERQWMSVDAVSGRVERGERPADQIATWRDNLIVAEKERISALVARIGRWIPGRVVMADPSVADLRVSGIFDLGDPQRALQAAVHPAGAKVRRLSPYLTVISPL